MESGQLPTAPSRIPVIFFPLSRVKQDFFSLQADFWESSESCLGPGYFVSVSDDIFTRLARFFANWSDFPDRISIFYLRRDFVEFGQILSRNCLRFGRICLDFLSSETAFTESGPIFPLPPLYCLDLTRFRNIAGFFQIWVKISLPLSWHFLSSTTFFGV